MKKEQLRVLGPRILVKVKKFKEEEVKETKKYIEGSNIILAPDLKDIKHETEMHTVNQCVGEVVQLGSTAYEEFKSPWVKPGDLIHFTRYGAIRIKLVEDDEDFEYWVLMAKDPLVIENVTETEERKTEVEHDRI